MPRDDERISVEAMRHAALVKLEEAGPALNNAILEEYWGKAEEHGTAVVSALAVLAFLDRVSN